MSKPFKLSAILHGHSMDVRSLAVTTENNIISGSRDKTAKFWRPNGFNTGYVEAVTYRDQKNFVACVLYLEPTNEYPEGLIATGGNDNKILIYKPHEPFATHCFEEHTNTVCTLSRGSEPNSLLSGSWDMTAKSWNLSNLQNSLATFSGHIAAVWSVICLNNGNIVTASADRTIRIWMKDGQQMKSLTGHTDCVRGLLDFPDLHCFLSVSNDATIRVWSYDGDNLNTYYGHTSFIYGICRLSGNVNNSFVTSDEERSVKIWENGNDIQTIKLPAQSVWCVACLPNGDIVTGASDGIIRIFTQAETRYAEASVLKAFEEEVNALALQSSQEIGGYKVSDLPGKEALYDPGKKAGQMKMIREPSGVIAYTWVEDGENSHWEKVGEVLGGTNNKTNEGQMFEGKGYDYVFSVDVEDGKPPVKLPYNKGDDPYVAAHNFLAKNNLPPSYLDQVADFIIKNSSEAQATSSQSADYVDPYTGSSRYTPIVSQTKSSSTAGLNVDPFTGASSYSTSKETKTQASGGQFFPQNNYRSFDMGDPNVVLTKLQEFNKQINDNNLNLSDADFSNLAYFCDDSKFNAEHLPIAIKILNWPEEYLFPAVDLLRFAVKSQAFNREISLKFGEVVLEKFKSILGSSAVNNVLVTFRALCNFFTHPYGEELIFKYRIDLLESLTSLSSSNKNVQIGIATFLLNSVILSIKRRDEIGFFMLSSVLPDMIVLFTDAEAQFRALVALGTLLCETQPEYKSIKEKVLESRTLIDKIKNYNLQQNNESNQKVMNCASEVQKILFN